MSDQFILYVRDDAEEARVFGPYRSLKRAQESAEELNAAIGDAETPAWAYVVRLEPGTRFRLAAVREWMRPPPHPEREEAGG